jgi:hypothetical protein
MRTWHVASPKFWRQKTSEAGQEISRERTDIVRRTPRSATGLACCLRAGRQLQENDFPRGNPDIISAAMNIRSRCILLVAPVALTLAGWLPDTVIAADFDQAQVTQVVKDVKVLPSGSAARPATVNETVHKGSAVQTGTQSRSELTFQDKSITRLGEKTIFSVGKGGRTIDLGSGQFLLYVPKNSGGAKVKMGSVTAAITG